MTLNSTQIVHPATHTNDITSFYGSSCANNNGQDALNTPETRIVRPNSNSPYTRTSTYLVGKRYISITDDPPL